VLIGGLAEPALLLLGLTQKYCQTSAEEPLTQRALGRLGQ